MLRMFTEHYVRHVESLDGLWDFVIAPERKDTGKLPSKYNRKLAVPGAWETIPGLENYRGKGWLRREIVTTDCPAMRLAFGAVSHTATVYIDGKKIGSHYDGFVPFDIICPAMTAGAHELVIEVDNTFTKESVLHQTADHWTSGGITRPVEFQMLDGSGLYIDKIFATPHQTGKTWALDVRVRLTNVSRRAVTQNLLVHLDLDAAQKDGWQEHDFGPVEVPARASAEFTCTLAKLDVKPWTDETPVLYYLTAGLFADYGDGFVPVDDKTDRIGFREVKVKGDKLLVNGQPVQLRGYNRHEYHGEFSHALPEAVHAGDIQRLKDLGCNFIRTSHYPNDMRFLDMCDEAGIYVWEETNSTSVDLFHKNFYTQMEADAISMVEWHFNRPSIIIWATLNECGSKDRKTRKAHKHMLDFLRSLDSSRPVTYASNAWTQDTCQEFADIVSWNWYEGWYGGSPETVEAEWNKLMDYTHSHPGSKGKPVLVSEFGAGSIPGWHNPTRERWTEEFQADVLDETLRVYLADPRVVGVAIWQFNDVRIGIEQEFGWSGRPRQYNNKGTFSERRVPKMCYDVVKKRMLEAKKNFAKQKRKKK
jgi:beta-glucuronidase